MRRWQINTDNFRNNSGRVFFCFLSLAANLASRLSAFRRNADYYEGQLEIYQDALTLGAKWHNEISCLKLMENFSMLNKKCCPAQCLPAQCTAQHFEHIAHREHTPLDSPNRVRAAVGFCLGVMQNLSHFERSTGAKYMVFIAHSIISSRQRRLKVPPGALFKHTV